MSPTYTEHQMLSEIVMQLKRIADALEKMEPRDVHVPIKPMEPFNPNTILPKD